MMFPKPVRKEKDKTPYNSLQNRKAKPKKEVAEWKKDILSHHQSKPSKADRAEFPKAVVKQANERSQGICQHCKQAPCTTTHHVYGRGRGGRGVLSNAYRACGNCHINIEGNYELKNTIIDEYRILYGDRFWYDEEDWNEFYRKQASEKAAEEEKNQRSERINPVVELLSVAAGRSLKAKEIRLIDGMNEKDIATFSKLMGDIIGTSVLNETKFGFGHFDD